MTPTELSLPPEPEVGTRWRGQKADWKRTDEHPEGWGAAPRGEEPQFPAWTFGGALSYDGPFTALDEEAVTPSAEGPCLHPTAFRRRDVFRGDGEAVREICAQCGQVVLEVRRGQA